MCKQVGLGRRCHIIHLIVQFMVMLLLFVNRVKLTNSTSGLSPVILVPGDGGCQIEAKWNKPKTVEYVCAKTQTTWATLWLSISDLSPYIVNCFVDNMKLVYDNKTHTTHNNDGVVTRVPGFGDTISLEYLDPFRPTHYFMGYFDAIAGALVKIGYQRNVTLRGAPFDFRKAPNELDEFYRNLTNLVEESFGAEGRRVTLIAHSMGAPVLHYFFNHKTQQWKDKYIQTVISLAGAWAGSFKPIKVYAAGDNLGYWLISASRVKILQRSFPSVAFLMPSRVVWDVDEVLVETPSKNYSLANIKEFFSALAFNDGYEMYQDTKNLLYNAPPPGVEIHCLHGAQVPTTEKLMYSKASDFPSSPTLVTGDGDGTVNKRSAEFCLRWARQQKQKIYHTAYNKTDHMAILSKPEVLKYITDHLKGLHRRNGINTKRKTGLRKRKLSTSIEDLESNKI